MGLLLLAGCAVIGAIVVMNLRIDIRREQSSGQGSRRAFASLTAVSKFTTKKRDGLFDHLVDERKQACRALVAPQEQLCGLEPIGQLNGWPNIYPIARAGLRPLGNGPLGVLQKNECC